MVIYQDLVDVHRFSADYASLKIFVRRLRRASARCRAP
jgi:hypothetical protein